MARDVRTSPTLRRYYAARTAQRAVPYPAEQLRLSGPRSCRSDGKFVITGARLLITFVSGSALPTFIRRCDGGDRFRPSGGTRHAQNHNNQLSRRPDIEMKKRILIADDDPAVLISLARVLESEEYEVIPARTGRQAVSQVLAEEPHLVLLDLNMPEKDGWEAFELMEKLNPFLPVIVITARPNQYDLAVRLGIDAFMEKPLDLPLLLATVKQLLAEPEQDRIVRLTKGNFVTAYLRNPPVIPAHEYSP
jgi:CheY-like chemotaxis protein